MDMPALWVSDIKRDIISVPIRFIFQIVMQGEQIIFQIILEILDVGLAAFSKSEFEPRINQIL